MKYLHLIWAALFRRKARMILTLSSVLMAFLLFGLLDSVRSTFASVGQSAAGHDRLLTIAKINGFGTLLPFRLGAQIEEMPGVAGVEYGSILIGTYQKPENSIFFEGHRVDHFFRLYPELDVAPAQREALKRTRSGVLVGAGLAKKYGWKVGDKIPLQSKTLRQDGSDTWLFDVVGTYRFTDPGMKIYESLLYGHWDYLNESRAENRDTVSWYSTKVANLAEMDPVARAIDALSANSDHETKTQAENAMMNNFFNQLGDMGLIVTAVMGAVFFTLILLAGHTMTQAVRERIPEMAVLKTLGFTGRSIMALVLSESIVLMVLGAITGLMLATLALIGVRTLGISALPIPVYPVDASVWARGLTFAALIGLLVGLFPALRGLRLRITDALAGR